MIRNLLDQVPRAGLDRRFRAFVEALPPSLSHLAADRRLVAGDGPSRPLQTVAEIGIAVSGPWAFCDTFPGLSEGQMLDLGETWLYLILAIVLRDHLVDGQLEDDPESGELLQVLLDRADHGFRALVGDRQAFWQRYQEYEHQLLSALQLEARYRTRPDETYDLAMAFRICAGKSALFKTVPCAMAVLCDAGTGALSRLECLEHSIDSLAAGRQLVDDIVDWQEDLARGHYTFPLIKAMSLEQSLLSEPSAQAIEAAILNSTIREELLLQVRAWYRQALAAGKGIPCRAWTDFMQFSLAECTWYHRWLVIHQIVQAVERSASTKRAPPIGGAL